MINVLGNCKRQLSQFYTDSAGNTLPALLYRGRISKHYGFAGKRDYREKYDLGKGVIMLTGHFGNWELGGAHLNRNLVFR